MTAAGDARPLVAGVDTSTQSCTVVVRDAGTGALVRQGRAPHPEGTEVDPAAWERALGAALAGAGGLDDIAAVAAQPTTGAFARSPTLMCFVQP